MMGNNQLAIRDDMSLNDLGGLLAKSGYFTDAKDAAQAVVKVLAGRELGFGPIASMTGIYIVKGRVSLSANLMAAAVRRSGRYTFIVRELSEKNCAIEFFEINNGKRESIGVSSFALGDAQRAGTQNLDKFPRNMLYARAMSNGVKWFCPDVTGGPIYTPEELGETVNEDGEIIDSTPALAMQSQRMSVADAIPPAQPAVRDGGVVVGMPMHVSVAIPPKPDGWKDEITALALNAKALADANHDPIAATRCRTAVDAARALFKANGSATQANIDEVREALMNAIAQASQA